MAIRENEKLGCAADVVLGGIYTANPAFTCAPGRINGARPYDQNYGIYVALEVEETGEVWMIDTYHISSPSLSKEWEGRTRADRFINGFLSAGKASQQFVSQCRWDCYYNSCAPLSDANARSFQFRGLLSDYEEVDRKDSRDYDEEDLLYDVKLWREHNYPSGIVLKRRGAGMSAPRVVDAAIADVYNGITAPSVFADYQKVMDAARECPDYDQARLMEVKFVFEKITEMAGEWRKFRSDVRRLAETGDISAFAAWEEGVPVDDICPPEAGR